jgi:hypothetical protein
MPPTAQTAFYKGFALLGGAQYPILGWNFNADPQRNLPAPLGNWGQYNWSEGFIRPFINLNLLVRDWDTAQASVLSSTFLDPFFTRSADAAHDTTAITNGLVLWNGRAGWTCAGVKPEAFTISGGKGEPVTMSASFCAAEVTRLLVAPSLTAWSATAPVTFKGVNFTNELADRVQRFNLSYSNNHTPDMTLNGKYGPAAWNAGMWTSGLQVTVQEADADALAGYFSTDGTTMVGGLNDVTDVSLVINGQNAHAAALTLALNNLLVQNPNSNATQQPRLLRDISLTVRPATGQGCPLTKTSSTF